MRDPARIDKMVELLRAKWHQHPDMRLGQLIMNHEYNNLFMIEDDEMEERLKRPYFTKAP